jgi:hypothetical protein
MVSYLLSKDLDTDKIDALRNVNNFVKEYYQFYYVSAIKYFYYYFVASSY